MTVRSTLTQFLTFATAIVITLALSLGVVAAHARSAHANTRPDTTEHPVNHTCRYCS